MKVSANLAKSEIEKGAIYKKCALEQQALNAGEHKECSDTKHFL